MSHQWISREEVGRIHEQHARERLALRDLIIELMCVVIRVNTRGFYDRLIQRVYLNAGVTPEMVAERQAKKAAKAAAYRAREERGA